jgi:hypothetical protein
MDYSDYTIPSIGVIVGAAILIYMVVTVGNVFQTASDIDNSTCRNITVVDKFANVNGGMFGSNTNYYITDDKNLTYKMWISGNITEIGEWNRIVVGNAYGIRISGSDATFCNSQKLLF